MPEEEKAQAEGAQAPAIEANEFEGLLSRDFKARTPERLDGVKKAVQTLAEEALKQTELISDDVITTVEQMIAAIGKAKTLGERSLGHPDPGAVSTYLMLKFMAEVVSQDPTPLATDL